MVDKDKQEIERKKKVRRAHPWRKRFLTKSDRIQKGNTLKQNQDPAPDIYGA